MDVLIGVAWPYASGPRHLGHLAGAYLPADVAARYRVIDVTLEPADGNPSRSGRTVLRGAYA